MYNVLCVVFMTHCVRAWFYRSKLYIFYWLKWLFQGTRPHVNNMTGHIASVGKARRDQVVILNLCVQCTMRVNVTSTQFLL